MNNRASSDRNKVLQTDVCRASIFSTIAERKEKSKMSASTATTAAPSSPATTVAPLSNATTAAARHPTTTGAEVEVILYSVMTQIIDTFVQDIIRA